MNTYNQQLITTMSFTHFSPLPYLLFCCGALLFASCKNQPATPPAPKALTPMDLLPALVPTTVKITDLHCWSELGNFFITGVCENTTDNWQKIWLRMEPMDAAGQPVTMSNMSISVSRLFLRPCHHVAAPLFSMPRACRSLPAHPIRRVY